MSKKRQALDPNNPVVKKLEINALFRDLDQQRKQEIPPQSLKELEQQLQHDGQKWRDKHKKEFKNGNVKVFHPSPRIVADILEHHLNYGIIANDDEEMEHGQVSFCELDSGIYKESHRLLKKLATCVERTLTTRQLKEVMNYLFLDSHRLMETRSKWLIPVNNGVFNQHTHQLEPFSPKYVFRHKIMTNYNPNAT